MDGARPHAGPRHAGAGGAGDSGVKGRDTTSTRAVGVAPKAVKKIAAAKPPKPAEPEPPPGKKPTRVGRVDPNGLLVEAFTIPGETDKLPDFAAAGAPG